MCVNVRNKLNPNKPKDAETIRYLLENDSVTGESEEEFHENNYAQIKELINEITLETPSISNNLTSEGPNAEHTHGTYLFENHASTNHDSVIEPKSLSYKSPMISPSLQIMETSIHTPEPTIKVNKGPINPSVGTSTEIPRYILTRSQAKKLEEDDAHEKPIGTRRNSPPKPLPEDEDDSDTESPVIILKEP